ncbi:MAG TPA: hypothetical protein VJJ21_02660 [Candidatus Nanoarchaeia archaeon]|nr:hypothetical protein [Candidatus Nanoarchaeia archaeon]
MKRKNSFHGIWRAQEQRFLAIYEKYRNEFVLIGFIVITLLMLFIMHPSWFT